MAKRKPKSDLQEVPKGKEIPHEVAFEYLKSNFFRVVTADGAIAGVKPSAEGIQFSLYSERLPLADVEFYELHPTGRVGKRIGRKMKAMDEAGDRPVFVREIEISVVMNIAAARAIAALIVEKANEAETIYARKHSVVGDSNEPNDNESATGDQPAGE